MPRPLVILALLCLVAGSYLLLGDRTGSRFGSGAVEVEAEQSPEQGFSRPIEQSSPIAEAMVGADSEAILGRVPQAATDNSSGVAIEMIGYPESVEPRIMKRVRSDGPPSTTPVTPLAGARDSTGVWRFTDLPLDANWQVVFYRQFAPGQFAEAQGLSPRPFVGPTDEVPLVELKCKLSDGVGVTGVFIDHVSGVPIEFDLGSAARFKVSAHSALGPHKSVKYWIELFEGGRFIAQPLAYAVASHRLSEVRSIEFIDLVENRACEVEIAVRSDETWSDLGEVRLGETPPLLAVHLVDESGAAIVQASVQLVAEIEEESSTRWEAINSGQAKMSDDHGQVRYFSPSMDEAFAFGYSEAFLRGREPIRRLSLRVSAPGYVSLEHDFSASERHIKLTLTQSGQIKWRMRRGELERASLVVVAVPTGSDPSPEYRLDDALVKASNRSGDTEWIEGSLNALAPGVVDIVVLLGTDTWELMRVPNQVVYLPSASESEQVLDLDLPSQIHWFRATWLNAKGRVVDPAEVVWNYRHMYRTIQFEDGVRSCGAEGILIDGRYCYALPRSVTTISGRFSSLNYTQNEFEDLAVGSYEFTLKQD